MTNLTMTNCLILMVGLWTVAEFNLILLMMVCRAAPGRVRLPRVCQSPVGTLPAYSDKEAKGGFIKLSV